MGFWVVDGCNGGNAATRRALQVLKTARAKGLYESNVASFYNNLDELFKDHTYPPECVWNCDSALR